MKKSLTAIIGSVAAMAMVSCGSDVVADDPGAQFTHYQVSMPDSATRASLALPLDIPVVLSANFTELRPNHFHNGVDFKTQGETGKKIHSVADGYVSRVSVAPSGYGRAVYIAHPELGLVSIYGHLESFCDTLASIVADRQMRQRSFEVDIEFPAGAIPVSQGDVVALSGNSGTSFGPHLHFTLSDLAGNVYFDPLDFYGAKVNDTTAPEVRSLTVIAEKDKGLVEGAPWHTVKYDKKDSPVFEAWGLVSPSIEVYDRMNKTSNIYGVKQISLEVDDSVVWHYNARYVEAEHTRAINTLVHYPTMIDDDILTITTVQPASTPLAPMISGSGLIDVNAERDYKCRFVVTDHHGNVATAPFVIRGVPETLPEEPVYAEGEEPRPVRWGYGGTVEAKGIVARIPPLALYDDFDLEIAADTTVCGYSYTYTVGDERITLDSPIELDIEIVNDTHPEKRQYCVVDIDYKGNKRFHGGEYTEGRIKARTNRLGVFTVDVDTIAPEIKPYQKDSWKSKDVVKVKATDNLSGIARYEAYIGDEWLCMEYDAKNSLFICPIDRKIFPKSDKHTLKITITDACGNSSTVTYDI